MKRLFVLIGLGLCLLVGGCAEIPFADTEPWHVTFKRVMDNPETTEYAKKMIVQGKIFIGMKRDELFASWGQPVWWSHCTTEIVMYGTTYETYDYSANASCSSLVFLEDGVVVGWSN